MIGTKMPNMTYNVCNIFEPTVFEGRLCYQTNAEKNPGQIFFEGKGSGLMLIIDTNAERSVDISDSHSVIMNQDDISAQDIYLGKDQLKSENMASIHIGTLTPYTGYGPGDYELTAIKQMTGTENFLAWPEEKRKCSLEKYEKCQMKGFLEESMACGCSPFQLQPVKGKTDQVRNSLL